MTKPKNIVHVITIVDGTTEDVIDLIQIDRFTAKEFYSQFDVDPVSDPEMLERYSIGPDDLPFLEKHLGQKLEFNFTQYAYFIEAARK